MTKRVKLGTVETCIWEIRETRVLETIETDVREVYQKPLLAKHEALLNITGQASINTSSPPRTCGR